MTTPQDTLRLALDYIEKTAKFVPHTHDQAGCDVAVALREALAQQGETEDFSWMDAEDAMFEQIDIAARKSFRRYKSSVRGQQVTRADGIDSHLVWATLEWAKNNSASAPVAQHISDSKLLMLTTAYEQGVGKGIKRQDFNPYSEGCDEHRAWALGYEEGADKQAPQTQQPLDIRHYVNAANIQSNDTPHGVVFKLQSAIERAHGIGEKQ